MNLDNFLIFLSLCSYTFYKLVGSKAIWSKQMLSVSFFMLQHKKKKNTHSLENFISYSDEVKSGTYHFRKTYPVFCAKMRQQFYL